MNFLCKFFEQLTAKINSGTNQQEDLERYIISKNPTTPAEVEYWSEQFFIQQSASNSWFK